MQGFIQIERFNLSPDCDHSSAVPTTTHDKLPPEQRNKNEFVLLLIARRSRFRAGKEQH